MDLVFSVPRLPREGETLTGGDLKLYPGGKGANQACAAARLGGQVLMVAHVGADSFGEQLTESLQECGVDTSRVAKVDRATGCASIYVLPSGANSIVISPGANATLSASAALRQLEDLTTGDFLLAQLETPLPTIEAAFHFARERGATTMLDPAPAHVLSPSLLRQVDVLTPNQTEAGVVLGSHSQQDVETVEQAQARAGELLRTGIGAVILKLGALGCLWASGKEVVYRRAYSVKALDTTAAGDVFNGAFAVARAEGRTISESLGFANAAAALSVTRHGAQSSIPTRTETDEFVKTVTS
jgi:ribokinase